MTAQHHELHGLGGTEGLQHCGIGRFAHDVIPVKLGNERVHSLEHRFGESGGFIAPDRFRDLGIEPFVERDTVMREPLVLGVPVARHDQDHHLADIAR